SYMNETYRGYADLPKIIQEKNAEGALFMRFVSPKLVRAIQSRGIPVVAVDHYPPIKQVNSLQIDNRTGGLLAAQHLIELGHRKLAMLYAAKERPSIEERAQGFRAAFEKYDLPFNRRSSLIEARHLTFDGGYEAALTVLKSRRRLTGLCCANDEVASGVLRAAHQLGYRIPE